MQAATPENTILPTETLPETVVSADPKVRFIQTVRDLYEYRELFLAFVTRDIKVRYKQTALGVAWVVLQPLLTGVVFSVIFGLITGRFGGLEGLLFFMAGLVPWTSFQNGVQMASASMESNANLISKVYFPRMVIPGAYVTGSIVDFLISFVVLALLAAWAGVLTVSLLAMVPVLIVLQFITAWGVGLFLSALNAQYRDVKYAVPFLLQTAMFVTVLMPPETWIERPMPAFGAFAHGGAALLYVLMTLNPMAAVIENYRDMLSGLGPDFVLLAKGFLVALLLLLTGFRFFASRERRLVDIL